MYSLRNAAGAIMRACAASSYPSVLQTPQSVGAAACMALRKYTGVFSAHADPIACELSSFGETTVDSLLTSKGDDETWLWCTTKDNVLNAITKMSRANVGSLIVLDDTAAGGDAAAAIRGIFTERDYMKKIVLEGRNSAETSIHEIMTPKSVMMTIGPNHSVMEAMDLMVENQIRHLPVLKDDRILGMVSIRDVVTVMVSEHKKSMEMMSSYINGTY